MAEPESIRDLEKKKLDSYWEAKDPPYRIKLLDDVRGWCLVLMMAYHGAYLLGLAEGRFHWVYAWQFYGMASSLQPLVAALFILISGFCAHLSANNGKRALQLGLTAAVISLFTIVVLPQFGIGYMAVRFGILHMLACAKLLYHLLRKVLDKIPVLIGFTLFLGLFLFTFTAKEGYFALFDLFRVNLPDKLVQSRWLYFLGFGPDLASFDYFPLLPYVFLFLSGACMGKYAKKGFPKFCYESYMRPIGYLGKHSLIVYLLHIPVLYGLFTLLQTFTGLGSV